MNETAAQTDLMTTSMAARLAGVSAETVRLWMRDGRLAHQSTPLGALISQQDVAALIATREQRAVTVP